MMLHSRIASFPPSFSFLNVRLVSLALLLVMSVLAGCATKPGLPDDQQPVKPVTRGNGCADDQTEKGNDAQRIRIAAERLGMCETCPQVAQSLGHALLVQLPKGHGHGI